MMIVVPVEIISVYMVTLSNIGMTTYTMIGGTNSPIAIAASVQ